MQLRFNPFQIFRSSRTSVGLYARKQWLDEGNTQSWQVDFRATVDALLAGQAEDGSWGQSIVTTIQRLFGLHLTIRSQNEPINKALDWLMGKACTALNQTRADIREHFSPKALHGLPFTPGCPRFLILGATLFLASIFGRENDKRILSSYERLSLEGVSKGGRWCGWSCSNNVLRAFVVHPKYSQHEATALAVEALADIQSSSGAWLRQVPFYQTTNALAHLDFARANSQLERAFKKLYESQQHDGTWGRSQREWNTFLIVHGLRNKGVL
jgi:hypothetical protein